MIRKNWLTIMFGISGIIVGLLATKPGTVILKPHGPVVPMTSTQPLHAVLTTVFEITIIFTIWGKVLTALLSTDRYILMRRYWLAWVLGVGGFFQGFQQQIGLGHHSVTAGLNSLISGPGITFATLGIAITWVYYRYTVRIH